MTRDSGIVIRDLKYPASHIPSPGSRISHPGTRIPSPASSLHLLEISRLPTFVHRGFGRAVEPEDGEISFAGHRGLPVAFLALGRFRPEVKVDAARTIGLIEIKLRCINAID